MAVYHKYKFRIAVAYTKSKANLTEIVSDKAQSLSWGKGYWGFKSDIRTYLRLEQNNRCAFCRCKVSTGTSFSNLEHLVGKKAYPQFEFLPENLVYSCTKCNMGKGKNATLSSPTADKALQTFPTNSYGFNIINPYHDKYEDHVDFLDEIIIIVANNSIKGNNTINYYKLTRPELAEQRAEELQLDKQALNKQLVKRLLDPGLNTTTIAQIQNAIATMPTWVLDN